ncbi:MAG: hypothetical protein JWQ38_2664 [Flavipsychrobacter sp.]|nr:hypothetical protein [Flavipsychrobacter sp.]
MKKIMLSLLCAGIAASASAQKNSVLLFGGIGGNTTSSSVGSGPSTSASTFNFRPGVGYQVNDNWTFGVEAIFDYTNNIPVSTPAVTGTNTNAGGGLFGRYTHPLAGVFSWYLQADATYAAGNMSVSGTSTSSSTMAIGITPAVAVNLKNGFAINFGFGNLGFNYMSVPTPDVHVTTINYNFFQGASFGMSKNFAKKAKPTKKHSDAEGTDAE